MNDMVNGYGPRMKTSTVMTKLKLFVKIPSELSTLLAKLHKSLMLYNALYILHFGNRSLLLNLNVNNSFLIHVIFKHNIK